MNTKIRKQIERRKRRIARRLDKNDNRGCDRPIMTASNIHYEIADRTRATAHGGIGAIHLLVQKLGLDQAIDRQPRPAEDPSALPRVRPRAEHRLQPAGRRHVPGAPGTAAQRRGLPRRPGRPPHSRPDHGRRLLPPLRRGRHLPLAGDLQRHPPEGLAAAARRRSSRRRSSTPTARWSRPPASASRAWTSTTRASGAIIRWSSRWPTRASRCSWSTAAATGPATSRPPSTSTGRSPCAARQASGRSACGATPTSRRPRIWTAGTPDGVQFVFGIDATPTLYELAGELPPERLENAGSPGEVRR